MNSPLTLPLAAVALLLTACGDSPPPAQDASTSMDASQDSMAEDATQEPELNGGVGQATGTIESIGADRKFVTIDHGPFDGIDMGAMTMGFEVMGDTELTGFSEGDQVSFEVKRGRDGSYRVIKICAVDASGADCLAD
jgi:Cu(I)/Ag(I) efflux system periplasmic protein CusF